MTDKVYARFVAAEENNFEALPMFGIAVLAALQAGVGKDVVTLHATYWVICRAGYNFAYLLSWGPIARWVSSAPRSGFRPCGRVPSC